MSTAGSLVWFARHELRLAWRDWTTLLTAGNRRRVRIIAIAILVVAALMHLIAYAMLSDFIKEGVQADKATLLSLTVSALLVWSVMLSQALESVTRAFYARADLDLILASPADARKLFMVRIAAIAVAAIGMAVLIAAPFINIMALCDSPRWLGTYVTALAMGLAAAAAAVALVEFLFRTLGPKRTRIAAQVVAAIIGAAFVIGLQTAAILSAGTISRFQVLQSDVVLSVVPGTDSLLWLPARALLGEPAAVVIFLVFAIAALVTAIVVFSARFGANALAAGTATRPSTRQQGGGQRFRPVSQTRALREKEWKLLRRDPWLLSQSLLQVLYLVPPAVLLWQSFGARHAAFILIVPILVMAAGQLAGGLAWLAISGEDAADLIASAPIAPRAITRAKVEAVIGAVALIFLPFLIALAIAAPREALATAAGILVAAGGATAIQLWFRVQAKRSHFRRRQTSSRLATFAEAFSSIGWAAAAALAASATWLALIPAFLAAAVLTGAWLASPTRA
ncbi:MAG: permease [Rhizobiales bacterium]|nr:permease [Hyphomicrobiales bacterium]